MATLETLIRDRLAHNHWGILGNQGYVLGVDLGSYGLRVALANLQHHTFHTMSSEEVNESPDEVVERVIAMARALLNAHEVSPDHLVRVGVGFGGPVDLRFGTVRLAPRQPGWENYPLQERFEQAFDAVTVIDNDANVIALGEATFGVGAGCQHLVYLHLSSGVGGGLVLNGRLYHGATSTAGEIGHAVVGRGWDGTGRPETLEELVSITGLLQRARRYGLETDNLDQIFGESTIGRRVVQETVDLIAVRCAQTVALIDPEMIVLGGVVVRIGGEDFVQAIAEKVNTFIAPQFARPLPVVASVLGPESVTVGAIANALDSLSD
ncbi:ROK family protein [Candidatus Chloroploca sp. M-50]|uniref:ROK family protein n=1 Tax=Candidatus Chloroploca mongolica TaxID=2528176 RepID=A0ABS4DE73_9CHLR|nr:ROK family protein [Candidatus Chloroploca mongolica]MBP1467754.1 ROK family protein [Candidatus Chloroploca mongolica]